jgi:Cupin-like domain
MLVTVFTVCVVLFLYLHVTYHFKTSNDLEVFELDEYDKTKLEEVCNLRQPCSFTFWNNEFESLVPENFSYDDFEINVEDEGRAVVPLTVQKARRLFKKSHHHTEGNGDFLEETMLARSLQRHDHLLRPPMVSSLKYDLLFGGENATTKLRYRDNFRNFFLVIKGEVKVRLATPKSGKRLDEVKDYVRQDFHSLSDPWGAHKVKFLETTLTKGQTLFVPAYWWHSIKFGKGAVVVAFYYKTVMNVVSTLPSYVIGMVQRRHAHVLKS